MEQGDRGRVKDAREKYSFLRAKSLLPSLLYY